MIKKVTSLFIFLFLIVGISAVSSAKSWQVRYGDSVIRENQTVEGDLVFNGQTLEVNGTIQGDLVVMAKELKINGKVEGDVLGIIFNEMTLSGTVGGDLRVLANRSMIEGVVDESATIASFHMDTTPDSEIKAGLLGFFNELKLNGKISGPVEFTGYSLAQVNGKIDGNLKIKGTPVTWGRKASVSGNVDDYSGVSDYQKHNPAVKIGGEYRVRIQREALLEMVKSLLVISFTWFIGNLLISLIFYRLFPRTAWEITQPTMISFRKNLSAGLFGFIGIPILIFLLAISVVGVPLAILLGLLYIILLLFSGVPLNIWSGRLLLGKTELQHRPVLLIVFGSLLLAFVTWIPFVGYFIQVLGVGMIVGNIRTQVSTEKRPDLRA